MKRYFADWRFSLGIALIVLGSGPLVGIILLAKVGLWPDPDPNPIGPGLICLLTLWPGIALSILGWKRVNSRNNQQ